MRAVSVAVLCVASACIGAAQVWLPPKGEGSLSITYQNVNFTGHFLDDGSREPPGLDGSRASNVFATLDYGLTNRLAVSLSIPYTANKYTGTEPPVSPSILDDHRYHGTFSDFRAEVYANLLMKPVVVTPMFALLVPSHDYSVVGEAAPGRGVNEYWVGVGAGRALGPILPRAYAQARYTYAFVGRVLDIPNNRSNVDLALGYFVTSKVTVGAISGIQRTHGGLTIDEVSAPGFNEAKFYNHDRMLRANFLHAGSNASFAVTQSMNLHATVVKFLSGSSTHYGYAITAGATWTFHPWRNREKNIPMPPPIANPARK